MAYLLEPMLAEHATETALVDERGRSAWHDLNARVDRWTRAFAGAGLRVGDRVAFVLGNRRETFEALLACLHSGLVAVPINWHLTAPEIAYLLRDSGSVAVLTESAHAEKVAAASTSTLHRILVDGAHPDFAILAELPDAAPPAPCSGGVLLYTSGTSGNPKGVQHPVFQVGASLERVARTAAGLSALVGIPDRGPALLVGPWYHSAQLFFAQFPLLCGRSLVLRARFDAEEVLDLIDTEQITMAHLVPTQFIRLLRARGRKPFSGASLIRIWHGGSPCPPEVKRAMIEFWGPVFVEYYAATEAGIATLIDTPTWLDRPGSVGRAVPPGEIVILGKDGAALPAGVDGAVCVRRPEGRTFSYHGAPEKTAAAHLAPNTFTVGDIGRLDQDGYLYLTARSVEIIVSGGVNIYPAEIEAVLLGHPAVADAVVIGVPDAEFGEQVKALVELEPGESEDGLPEALDLHCRATLAGFKVPRSYEFLDHLPREATGKIARQGLREPYWQTVDRRI